MNHEVFEVPETLVSTLTYVLNKAIRRGEDLFFQKKINGVNTTLTRGYKPQDYYPLDTRGLVLEQGIFRYAHRVDIQKNEGSDNCTLYYQLFLSGHLISNIIGSGNDPNLKVLSESPDFPSPYLFFSDFGFLQRPVTTDYRRKR